MRLHGGRQLAHQGVIHRGAMHSLAMDATRFFSTRVNAGSDSGAASLLWQLVQASRRSGRDFASEPSALSTGVGTRPALRLQALSSDQHNFMLEASAESVTWSTKR